MPRRPRTLPPTAAFAGAGLTFAALYLAAGAPTPLLVIFQQEWGGALRAITPLAEMHQRAGLFAAVYMVAYLSFGGPAIIAGLLVAPVGLLATVLGYGMAIIVAASAGLAAQIRNTRN